jgi:hypothetical protein
MSGLCSPPIIVAPVEGGYDGQFVNTETQKILRKVFSIPLQRIQDECNRVADVYRNYWNTKNPNDIMIEYGLPNTTYKDGLRELDPAFLLTCPSIIRMNILNSRVNTMDSTKSPDVAAGVLPHPTDPILYVFLPTFKIKDSTIVWTHRPSTSFISIIIHESLHLCGEVETAQRKIVDGVIRHTMIGTEAIEPLLP